MNFVPRKYGTGVWCYGERGNFRFKSMKNDKKQQTHSTIVFLPGIGINIDMWSSIVKHIPLYYHCVMVDMPGHGETTFIEGVDKANIEGFAESLLEFLEASDLDQFKVTLVGYMIYPIIFYKKILN